MRKLLLAVAAAWAFLPVSAQFPGFGTQPVEPYCQSVFFSAELDRAGRLEEFVTVPGGGHGPVTFNETTFKKMTDFFKKEAAR